MRRAITLLALLAAPLLAQEPDEPEVPEEEVVDEPIGRPPGGRIARGERDAPAAFVRLRDGGVLEAKDGDDWKAVTLAECSEFLVRAKARYQEEMENAGEPAFDEVSPGIRATRLFLAIDVEPAVPWQHVQWLTTIAAEQRIEKLECSVGAKRLLVRLPLDAAIEYCVEPPPEMKASVHLIPRKERRSPWGDVDVFRPTEVRFRCGDTDAADLRAVSEHVRKTKEAAAKIRDRNVVLTGEIKAGYKVPFGKVFEVMETFVDAGVPDVELYGTQIPSDRVRAAGRLPYPERNYARPD